MPNLESQQPLLQPPNTKNNNNNNTNNTTNHQVSIKHALFESTAHLANHLPTGTVLAFQILAPIFTNQGRCSAASHQTLTTYLLALCAVSCFLLSFTDSVRDDAGNVRYGIATWNGLWIIDGGSVVTLEPEVGAKHRLVPVDFVHAIMGVMVFGAVALLDQSVVSCFWLSSSEDTRRMLGMMPMGIGVLGSTFFVRFPTTRRGIGFPLSAR